MKNIALVLEGGALRGIFSAGVLDAFMEEGIVFPYIVSVSAGSCNALGYITGQSGRTKECMLSSGDDTFYGSSEFLKTRKIINFDKLFDEFPYKQFPFDFDTYFNSGIRHEIVATRCADGKPTYFSALEDPDDLVLKAKASCSMPVFCNEVMICGQAYLDGGMSDPIPVQHAADMGFDKMVVVLTRQDGMYPRVSRGMQLAYHMLYKDFPEIISEYNERPALYKSQIDMVHALEDAGKAFVFRPTIRTIGHFETDHEKLEGLYNHGYETVKKELTEFLDFLNGADDLSD